MYHRNFGLVDGLKFEGIDHDDTQIVKAEVPSTVPTKPEHKAGPAAVRYWPLHVLPALVGSSWAEKQHFNACCGAIWKWQRGGFWMWLLHAFVSCSLDMILNALFGTENFLSFLSARLGGCSRHVRLQIQTRGRRTGGNWDILPSKPQK